MIWVLSNGRAGVSWVSVVGVGSPYRSGPSLPEERTTIGASSPELDVLVELLEAPEEELANGFGPNLIPRVVGHVCTMLSTLGKQRQGRAI